MRRHVFAAGFLAALALPLSAASAHPKLVSSTPTANASVPTSPTQISATFNEPITLALSKLSLFDASARSVVLDSLSSPTSDGKTLVTKVMGKLAPGRYTVKWQAAGGDGHPMKGEFTFVVAEPGSRSPDNSAMAR